MNATAAIELLREVGLYRLAGPDGCLCMSCAVQGVSIDISCRKSSGNCLPFDLGFRGIVARVYSRHRDAEQADLQSVADEVALQLSGEGDKIATRLCEYRIDHEMLCVYCESPRDDPAGYFCQAHASQEVRSGFWATTPPPDPGSRATRPSDGIAGA